MLASYGSRRNTPCPAMTRGTEMIDRAALLAALDTIAAARREALTDADAARAAALVPTVVADNQELPQRAPLAAGGRHPPTREGAARAGREAAAAGGPARAPGRRAVTWPQPKEAP